MSKKISQLPEISVPNISGASDIYIPTARGTDNYKLSVSQILAQSNLPSVTPMIYRDLSTAFADEISQYADVWQWIKARIKAGNYKGLYYGDYIPFTTTDGVERKAWIMGVDTYTGKAPLEIPHHIDFIITPWSDFKAQWALVESNNGWVADETITTDGTSTTYTLTKPFVSLSAVTVNNVAVTNYTYTENTRTLTFTTPPAAGTLTATYVSISKNPFARSNALAYLNSARINVATAISSNTTITVANYTSTGISRKLPRELVAVRTSVPKIVPVRYAKSGTGTLQYNTGVEQLFVTIFMPSAIEVLGYFPHGNPAFTSYYRQYPFFKYVNLYDWLNGEYITTCDPTSGGNTDIIRIGAKTQNIQVTAEMPLTACFRIS